MNKPQSKPKLYVFGGSFDPFHVAHEAIVNAVTKEFGQILLIPTQNPWKTSSYIALEDKIKDLQEFFKEDSRVQVSSLCLDPEYNYMYKVVEHYPDYKIVFIMGEDAYEKYPQWKNYAQFKDQVETIVFKRSNDGSVPDAPRIRLLRSSMYQNEISSTLCRNNPKYFDSLVPLKMREIINRRLNNEKA